MGGGSSWDKNLCQCGILVHARRRLEPLGTMLSPIKIFFVKVFAKQGLAQWLFNTYVYMYLYTYIYKHYFFERQSDTLSNLPFTISCPKWPHSCDWVRPEREVRRPPVGLPRRHMDPSSWGWSSADFPRASGGSCMGSGAVRSKPARFCGTQEWQVVA